mmetsp:Transcript_26359/g.61482  ORF Transcript_26359/g.61482 Transcript_26359/m.61482 type:complete len:109 (-) Transcript_26359:8-334(-)
MSAGRQPRSTPPDSSERHAERLRAVWWVVDNRFDEALADCVRKTSGEEMPIFIIVNKCGKAAAEVIDVLSTVRTLCPWAKAVLPVASEAKHGPIRKACEACGSPRRMR